MKIGLGIGVTQPQNMPMASIGSASYLFRDRAQGTWYDPSDITTLYQDAAGTTPVTGIEQPVGLMLDKSKGLVLGPELVTNGDFATDSGWVKGAGWTIANGAASVSGQTATTYLSQAILTTGKTYEVIVDASGSSLGRIQLGNTGTNYQLVSGRNRFVGVCAGNTNLIATALVGDSFSIDNISVRELPGNHAFNNSGNSANFPVLSTRYNLLTKSEDFSDAVWNKNTLGAGIAPAVVENSSVAPDGTTTADKVTFVAPVSGDASFVTQMSTVLSGATYINSVYVKAATPSDIGKILLYRGVAGVSYSQVILTADYQRVSISGVAPGTSVPFDIGLRPSQGGSSGTVSVILWGADLRVANDALNQPAYQRVNTATDYDTVGFKPYLKFNGTNQWLQTNSIDFSYTDKMFVSAGVRKLSDPSDAIVFELGPNANTTNGTFALGAPIAAGINKYAYKVKGSTAVVDVYTANSVYSAPVTSVVAGISSIPDDQALLRVNGTQVAISTADQGTGNYGNYPLYIGARGGSSLWFNGRLYQLIIAGGTNLTLNQEDNNTYLDEGFDAILLENTEQVAQSQVELIERFVNTKTGAY